MLYGQSMGASLDKLPVMYIYDAGAVPSGFNI